MTFVHYDICVFFSSTYESQEFSRNIILNDLIKSIQMLSKFRKSYSTVCLSNDIRNMFAMKVISVTVNVEF